MSAKWGGSLGPPRRAVVSTENLIRCAEGVGGEFVITLRFASARSVPIGRIFSAGLPITYRLDQAAAGLARCSSMVSKVSPEVARTAILPV